MRGKEAAKAANRRAADADAQVAKLRAEFEQDRARLIEDAATARGELARFKANSLAEASRMAKAECERLLAKANDERDRRGFSDKIVMDHMVRMDMLVRNACRYLSMTTGRHPLDVFPMVMTWATDKSFRFRGDSRAVLFMLGLPLDGWVAQWLLPKKLKFWDKTGAGQYGAVALDEAEADLNGKYEIHPGYKPDWYKVEVEYTFAQIADEVKS